MDSSVQTSEFNMAVSYLARLNSLLYIADDAAMNLDAHQWFHALLALHREVYTEIKEDDGIDPRYISEINSQVNRQNRNNNISNEIAADLYMKLNDFEIKIRKVMKRTGLMNRMIDDATKALR